MIPLIDGDILLHEIGWSSQFKDKDTGEEVLLDWDWTRDLLTNKIDLICEEVGATKSPLIFLSDSEFVERYYKRLGQEWKYEKGFRYEVAKTKPYKGTRNNPKPFHFYNILVHLLANYTSIVSNNGLEADDMMCIYQSGREDTIICSRDKDLRICPGWHYSWECGGQRAVGPVKTDELGWLEKKDNGDVFGYGVKFFYYQMLAGDSADNIPGLPGAGKAKAFNVLNDLTSVKDCYKTVKTLYKEKMGEEAKEYFLEQANLLWMIQKSGTPYTFPK